jgi:hypothetical protein
MFGGVVEAVRRNHALEHGTVSILLSRLGADTRLVGRATPDGFYIYGRVPTEALRASANEALARLQGGEASLAVTPLCGTNLAVAGILAGLASVATMGRRNRLERLPGVFTAAMFGVLASQPLGRLVQQHLTTSPHLQGISIVDVRRRAGGMVHKVQTVRDAAY